MKFQKKLRLIRIILSMFFFLALFFIFTDIHAVIEAHLLKVFTFLQFIPSFIELFNVFSHVTGGFVFIIILTLLYGRFYCSVLCPLGTSQDIISWISRHAGITGKFRKQRTWNYIKYNILAITILTFIAGSMIMINLLDPYSNFGRMISNLVRPVVIELNNLLVSVLAHYKNYSLSPVKSDITNLSAFLFPLIFFIILSLFALFKGRLYCNSVCPVGTILGLFSRFSLYKIRISKEKCTSCGKCSGVCKAGCINLKTKEVDMENCVACFNCISRCPESGIGYTNIFRFKKQIAVVSDPVDSNRRKMLGLSAIALGSFISWSFKPDKNNRNGKGLLRTQRKAPVTPPGSVSFQHFTGLCTACHLCVSSCPTQVLQPSFLEYGTAGMLQPTMNFKDNFCNFNCRVCAEVCPTGAIVMFPLEEKQRIQAGIARFVKENCIVYRKEKDCGACSEHCPTKSCNMVSYINGLKIPEVDKHTCIGCGACEYACPVAPDKAIVVDGNPVHLVAQEPRKEEVREKIDYKSEFPF